MYHANRAACYMSLDEVEMAIHDCTDAVEYDPSYVRAWQRKCTANEKKGRYHDALDDSYGCVRIEIDKVEITCNA